MRYALYVLNDPEEPTRLRLKAAEIIIDAGMPKNKEAFALAVDGGGIDFLELRFVTPGQPATAAETITLPLQPTQRIAFDPATDVEGNETPDGG